MRTNIVLDETLIKEAASLTGVGTKRELIDQALRELIRTRRKKKFVRPHRKNPACRQLRS